mmetsp:Transcript_37778/g.83164  ORF Transcript_37778/g.83164 Transcript_37778/m.83164 type:complete len:363 (+) Transcript_37778:918-2006(+)
MRPSTSTQTTRVHSLLLLTVSAATSTAASASSSFVSVSRRIGWTPRCRLSWRQTLSEGESASTGTGGLYALTARVVSPKPSSNTRIASALASCASTHAADANGSHATSCGVEARNGCVRDHDSVHATIDACIATAESGNLPLADSPESITASACSSTAFVTSATSARVGLGLCCIDSSICVATITGLPAAAHMRTISFCQVTTCSSGTSTPKSPRATITPSDASIMSCRLSRASTDSIFEMISGAGVKSGVMQYLSWQCWTYSLISRTPSADRTNEAAIMSMSCSIPNRISSRSFSLSAGRSVTMPGRLTPLRSPISLVFKISQSTALSSGRTCLTESITRPSSSSTRAPTWSFCASGGYPT